MEGDDMNLAARPSADFEALVREHQDRVYRIACRVLRDPAGAEDVAQQVFLKLYQDGGLPTHVANPAAYVARAAVNTALKSVREEGRRDRREQAAIPRAASPDASVGLAVREAVDDLPSDLRLPVVLHYFEGLGYQEVSETLGVPAGTVAWRISEAKGKLRTTLAGIGASVAVASIDAALQGAELETAPPSLLARLRAVPRPPRPRAVPAPPAPKLPAVPILGMGLPAAIALVLLFTAALVVLVSHRPSTTVVRRNADLPATTTPTVASATQASGPVAPTETHAPGTAVPPTHAAAAPVENEEIQDVQGFLYRDGSGRIGIEEYQDPEDRFPDRLLRPESAESFAGIDLGGREWNDVRWGKSGRQAAPRIHVRLRATLEHEDAPGAGPGIDWVRVQEVVGVEWLSDAWIDAWQASGKALAGMAELRDEAPGEAKVARLQSLAAAALREIQALERLRTLDERPPQLRALQHDDRFRKGELQMLYGVLQSLAGAYDVLPKDLPSTPGPGELLRMFLEARDQASFRAAVADRWSEEAFAPETEAICDRPNERDEPLCWTLNTMVDKWTPMEFAREQEVARKVVASQAGREPAPRVDAETLRASLTGAGIEAELVSPAEEQAFMRINVLRVTSLEMGGLAARAGVREGDLLWGIESPDRVHTTDGSPDLWSALSLGGALDGARAAGRPDVTLVVLRDGALVPIRIPVR